MTTSKEQCTLQQMKYHAMFPDIPTMTSEEWITRTSQDTPDVSYVLVDVRSAEERNVSTIPQSVTLKQFERELEQAIQKVGSSSIAAGESSTIQNAHVVTYCTIGYRSGVEARRLRDKYGLDGRIYNLDGIIPYTHCIAIHKDTTDHHRPRLVHPKTGEETNKVHCYGSTWAECVNTDYFEPIIFSKQAMVIQNLKKSCSIM